MCFAKFVWLNSPTNPDALFSIFEIWWIYHMILGKSKGRICLVNIWTWQLKCLNLKLLFECPFWLQLCLRGPKTKQNPYHVSIDSRFWACLQSPRQCTIILEWWLQSSLISIKDKNNSTDVQHTDQCVPVWNITRRFPCAHFNGAPWWKHLPVGPQVQWAP